MPRNVNQHHRAATLNPGDRSRWERYLLDLMSSEPRSKALWAAVVNQAVRDAKSPSDTLRREARIWLGVPGDPQDMGSFAWVCEWLPLNGELVRRDVLK
jgi:hypothetical protein